MSTLMNVRTLAAAAAVIFVVANQASNPAAASTTSKLLSCEGNSMNRVVSCCKHVLETNAKPMWMMGSVNGCQAAVKCSSKAVAVAAVAAVAAPTSRRVKHCKVVVYLFDQPGDDGGGDNPPPRTPPSRNPQ